MSWLFVAALAQFVLGSSAVADKFLLKKKYPNPAGYTFWLAVLGLFALVLMPFGFILPPANVLATALFGGAAFTASLFLFFYALSRGNTTSVILLVGAVSPIFTYVFSPISPLGLYGNIAFGLLVAGGCILFLAEERRARHATFTLAIASALALGVSNVLSKSVFLHTNFVSGFIALKVGAFISALAMLAYPHVRKKIFNSHTRSHLRSRAAALYLVNRAYAALGSVLLFYALSFGPAPLVDASQNLKFVFVFLGGWLVLGEETSRKKRFVRIAALVLIVIAVSLLALQEYARSTWPDPNRQIEWGVTFSQKAAESLGLNWRANYDALLGDLGVKHLRLVAYWDLLEPDETDLHSRDLDYQMQEAERYGADVILAIGEKTPRWPECNAPDWAKKMPQAKKEEAFLSYIGVVVDRYKKSPALRFWQVENEPFLSFGECSGYNKYIVDKEIALVRSLDSDHQILVTDGGEFGRWYRAANRGDVFGTTMYRRIYNKYFGYIDYHLPPAFFRIKEGITRALIQNQQKKFIVAELAAEPWLKNGISRSTLEEHFKKFDLEFFKDTIHYAKAAGFDEYYLWGAEWWYWLKETQQHPEFWDFAKSLTSAR